MFISIPKEAELGRLRQGREIEPLAAPVVPHLLRRFGYGADDDDRLGDRILVRDRERDLGFRALGRDFAASRLAAPPVSFMVGWPVGG